MSLSLFFVLTNIDSLIQHCVSENLEHINHNGELSQIAFAVAVPSSPMFLSSLGSVHGTVQLSLNCLNALQNKLVADIMLVVWQRHWNRIALVRLGIILRTPPQAHPPDVCRVKQAGCPQCSLLLAPCGEPNSASGNTYIVWLPSLP